MQNLLKLTRAHNLLKLSCAHNLVNFSHKHEVVNYVHELKGNIQFCINRGVCMEISNSVLAVMMNKILTLHSLHQTIMYVFDLACAGDNPLKMRIFKIKICQMSSSVFSVIGLLSEVENVTGISYEECHLKCKLSKSVFHFL